jgi:hypothetical protein
VQNEGDIGVGTPGPYEIAMGAIEPKAEQASNLVVPVAVSSSHIAFGSIRMEPVFMVLGQSAGALAVLAIDQGSAVQDVPYDRLKERLEKAGQVLHYDGPASGGRDLKGIAGIVVDDEAAKQVGDWKNSTSLGDWIHHGYLHDGNPKEKTASLTFAAKLARPGKYRVEFAYPPHVNRSTKVRVTVRYDGGTETVVIDQKRPLQTPPFIPLGEFVFDAETPAEVTVSNAGADGHVVADAVRWLEVTR